MNRKSIIKHLNLLNYKSPIINGLLKKHCYIYYSAMINYTYKPNGNNVYNICYIEIPDYYSKLTLKTNNGNTFGQANSFIVFTNDKSSAGTRISGANVTNITITLNHNYKYIAVPLGINTTYAITNKFYSFDTATFEFS